MPYGKQKSRRGRTGKTCKRYFEEDENEYDYADQDDSHQKSPNDERPKFHRNDRGDNKRGRRRGHQNHQKQSNDNRLDKESAMYFKIVYERMHEPFENDEEKELFVENVVEQMQGKELDIAKSSLGCKTIQKVLELNTKCHVISKLASEFRNDIESLSSNQFSSLALQYLLTSCVKHLHDASNEIIDFVLATAEFCFSNFPGIMDHPFGNYVLKTVIHVLSGNDVFSFKRNQFECQPVFVDVPSVFEETFEKLAKCILSVENIEEYLHVDVFSFLVQHLIKASSHFPGISRNIANCILEILTRTENEDEVHPYLTGPSTSYIVEAILEHLDMKQRKFFIRKYIFKHLEKVIEHKQANNVIKSLIWKTKKKKAFMKLYDKVEPFFMLIFRLEHDTILVALADGCLRFDVCQARFVISLKEMLQCSEGNSQNYFVLCVLHMLLYEQYVQAEQENTATVSLNGSLLVQRLLGFSKPIKIAMAIVNMSLDNLKRICCDPKGCHIIDAFMNSKFVGEKSRDKLVEKTKEISITLACSPYGSRTVDAIWKNASLKQKVTLADSLAKNMEILSSNKFGKFIHRKLALYHFKNRFEEWKQVQTSQDKKCRLFNDIVQGSENQAAKRQKTVTTKRNTIK